MMGRASSGTMSSRAKTGVFCAMIRQCKESEIGSRKK